MTDIDTIEPEASDDVPPADEVEDFGRSGEPGKRAEPGKPYVDPVAMGILVALLVGAVLWLGPNALVVIAGIVVMIFFHELGHYVMARRADMMVTEFFIGFGPRIASFRRGDVEYGIKAIPAGAYVKIIGMADIEDVPPEFEARTYRQQTFPQRFGVAVAGSAMHFAMALILLFGAFAFVGARYAGVVDEEAWVVDQPSPGSSAEVAGIQPGDRVVGIDGVAIETFDEMGTEARRHPGETVEVDVLRDGNIRTLTVTLNSRMNIEGTVGEDVSLITDGDAVRLASVSPSGRLGEAGFEAGDQLVTLNGLPVGGLVDVADIVDASEGGTLDVVVVRGDDSGDEYAAAVDLGTGLATSSPRGFLGVGPTYPGETMSLGGAAVASVDQFADLSQQTVSGLWRVLQPASIARMAGRTLDADPTETNETSTPTSASEVNEQRVEDDSDRIVSIVGAVRIGVSLSETDWGGVVLLFIHLNIVIGIFNLIPLPPFDGGHVSVAIYERIREQIRGDGRRYFVSYDKLMPIAYGVVITLGLVSLMAIFLDLADPIPV